MKQMTLEYLKTDELRPYENNPRKNEGAIPYVMESIRQFGFRVPIIVDKDNVIVAGHTRLEAAKRLNMPTVPVIRADDLTEDQIKAYRIADNKVPEYSGWDLGKLEIELGEIDIDMSAFGFDLDIEEPAFDDGGWYGDERERTNDAYNLGLVDHDNLTEDFWQMPVIKNDGYIPEDLIGFNCAKTSKEKHVGIHFYVDDYQFERTWNDPEKYTEILREYDCILSPDFSLYMDMPMPMKIWNTYRSRFIGAFYQSKGLRVIPTISWAERETYAFCFRGIPKGSIVSISTVGVKRDKDALAIWHDGVDEMIRQIEPSAILVYGGEIDHDYGEIKVRYFTNKITENWKRVDKEEKKG